MDIFCIFRQQHGRTISPVSRRYAPSRKFSSSRKTAKKVYGLAEKPPTVLSRLAAGKSSATTWTEM